MSEKLAPPKKRPAQRSKGDAPGPRPKEDDIDWRIRAQDKFGKHKAYYDGSGYWVMGDQGRFIPVNEKGLTRRLEVIGNAHLNEMGIQGGDKDGWLTFIQDNYLVDYVGAVAGHPVGAYPFKHRQILVTWAAPITQATYGDNRIVWSYVDRLLGTAQAIRFHAWVKLSRQMLIDGDYSKFMGMIIAGKRDLGKTVLATITAPMFNDTFADPYPHMIGGTNFNRDLVEAALLLSDDRGDDPTQLGTRKLTTAIKEFTASGITRVEAKYANAGALDPFWRLMILLNDTEKALRPLHGLTHEMLDKVMILKAVGRAVDKPTKTPEQRRAFITPLKAGIPDYLGQLERWEVPVGLTDDRFMLKAWHHPDLLKGIRLASHEATLLELMDRAQVWEKNDNDGWNDGNKEVRFADEGLYVTANALRSFLIEVDFRFSSADRCDIAKMTTKLFPTVNVLSGALVELSKTHQDRVIHTNLRAPKTTGQGRFWLLKRPA